MGYEYTSARNTHFYVILKHNWRSICHISAPGHADRGMSSSLPKSVKQRIIHYGIMHQSDIIDPHRAGVH